MKKYLVHQFLFYIYKNEYNKCLIKNNINYETNISLSIEKKITFFFNNERKHTKK